MFSLALVPQPDREVSSCVDRATPPVPTLYVLYSPIWINKIIGEITYYFRFHIWAK